MTPDEAFAELGLDHDTSAEEVRRAYLKLLKIRKPEADPQGFMRLREAYELTKARLQARDAFFLAIGAGQIRVVPPAEAAPPAVEEEAPALAAADPPILPMEEPARREEAPPALASGDPAAPIDEPILVVPPALPPDDEPPDEATIDSLLAAGLQVPAAEELASLFDAAAKNVHGPTPPVWKALRLLLMLHAENAIAPAVSLQQSVSAWLRASGEEARVLRGEAAARWSLLRELGALAPTFPRVVRSAIARALLDGDLGQARGELSALHERKTRTALAAASELRVKAPLLAAALADALELPRKQPRPAPAPRSSFGKGGWALAPLAIALLRVIAMLGSGSSSVPSYHAPSPQSFSLPPSYGLDGGLYSSTSSADETAEGPSRLDDLKDRARRRAERTQAHAWYMVGYDGGTSRVDYPAVAADVDRVASALARDDCPAASAAMKKLEGRMIAGAGDEIGRVEVSTFGQTLRAFCAELARVAASAGGAPKSPARVVLDAGRCGGTESP